MQSFNRNEVSITQTPREEKFVNAVWAHLRDKHFTSRLHRAD